MVEVRERVWTQLLAEHNMVLFLSFGEPSPSSSVAESYSTTHMLMRSSHTGSKLKFGQRGSPLNKEWLTTYSR